MTPSGSNSLPFVRSELFNDISRIVVKFGTGVLTDDRKQPDLEQMRQLVKQTAGLREAGKEVVVVSSGAVGAGMGVLGHEKRPSDLAELQACAAVGQSRLMAVYENLFAQFNLRVAQVLLTHEDLEHHERHLNARNTLVTLLGHGVIPIINENDAISFTELKFGDNDKLSALVASLLPADLLVILTTVDGVIQDFGKPNARTLETVEQIDDALEKMAGGTESAQIQITAPDIAENGAVVPITIESAIARTQTIAILIEKNPNTLSANFEIADGTDPFVTTRVKMAETSNIYAVVKADGKYFHAVKEIKVTLGGCGG